MTWILPSGHQLSLSEERPPLIMLPYISGVSEDIRCVHSVYNFKSLSRQYSPCWPGSRTDFQRRNATRLSTESPVIVRRSALERPFRGWKSNWRNAKSPEESNHGDVRVGRAFLEHPAYHPVGWDYHSWPGQKNQWAEDKGGPAYLYDSLAPTPQLWQVIGAIGLLDGNDEADGARLHHSPLSHFQGSGRNIGKSCFL